MFSRMDNNGGGISPGSTNTLTKEKGPKVRLRNILGRIFSGGGGNSTAAAENSQNWQSINEISEPCNVVHKIHVGYDGQKFTGLPPTWGEVRVPLTEWDTLTLPMLQIDIVINHQSVFLIINSTV